VPDAIPSGERVFSVLFLCTGNSARSILAESMLNSMGRPRFKAYSAGSRPTGRVNAFALDYLAANRMPTGSLRSKSWDEFARIGAPAMDFVITVCDSAAGEVCPLWPGQPMTAHWGVPDPAAVAGSDADKRRATSEVARVLLNRIRIFVNLPFDKLDRLSLQTRVRALGSADAPVE
jgi:protein-tyrosine-phosphatase